MRIRRRASDVPLHAHPRPSSRHRSPPAPPAPSAPSRASSPSPEAAARSAVPAACEVKLTMCEEAPFDPGLPSRGQNSQGDKQDSDEATANAKTGKEDRRSEDGDGCLIRVACSTGAAPKGEQEERRTEAEEMKRSGDAGVQIKDEEKVIAFCRKGDGKGWQCKREARGGYSLCQYHLDKLRSYSCRAQTKKKPKDEASVTEQPTAGAGIHRQREPQQKQPQAAASVAEKPTAAAGIHCQTASQQMRRRRRMEEHALGTRRPGLSDSFYYYTGFGPQWGKRRRDRSEDGMKTLGADDSLGVCHRHEMADAAPAAVGEDDDEYDRDKPSCDGKPLKSRPLSSLLLEGSPLSESQ